MPTYSTIYKMPSPTAAESSDGPAAFTALGARIDREMTIYRGYTMAEWEAGPLALGAAPWSTLVQTSDHAMAIIGWIDVNVEVAIGTFSTGSNIAGSWRLLANNTQIASGRWHNYGFSNLVRTNLAGSFSIPAATTSVTVRVEAGADGPSAPAYAMFSRTMVRRYGAPPD